MKKILWETMTMEEIGALDKDTTVIIFPIGSIEGHGPHLPVECDSFNVTELAKKIALACRDEEITAVVIPTLRFGYSEWMDYPGKITLTSETFQSVVWDICKSIVDNGFKRILMLNGHGGNPHFLAIVSQTFYQTHKIVIPMVDWFQLMEDITGDIVETLWHADEGETSVSLALGMDVEMSKAVKELSKNPFTSYESRIAGVPSHKFFLPLTTVSNRSTSGVMGDATKATKEKGEKIVGLVVDRTIEIIKDLMRYQYDE
jgi:creatinine amidohydrolase